MPPYLQWPPLQEVPASQATPHAPQFALSLRRSLHTPESPAQSGRAAVQVQVELVQVSPVGHAVPQVAQFTRSLVRSMQVVPPSQVTSAPGQVHWPLPLHTSRLPGSAFQPAKASWIYPLRTTSRSTIAGR